MYVSSEKNKEYQPEKKRERKNSAIYKYWKKRTEKERQQHYFFFFQLFLFITKMYTNLIMQQFIKRR